ncbi:hypothetical protein [Actinacidiphila paucisporea]|uniref:Uncharacterized protein n=1 Tax=Actinacidiphila paucisporea TaxID=310782 RepID=A0A1M6TIK7_9ACTN|nr:hypothetical protein [Actinacidiphila paucisporea]SHK56770.1 hypothetical protein SAMN05216499_10157 [Actinacidiphila paucisporea]
MPPPTGGRRASGGHGLSEVPEDFRDLFLGRPDESAEQRTARLTAARDVLAELLDQGERDAFAMEDALHAVRLGGASLFRGHRWAGEAS